MDDGLDVLRKLANDKVERHIGDTCDQYDESEIIHDDVLVLAFNAVVDSGASLEPATQVAEEIAAKYGRQ